MEFTEGWREADINQEGEGPPAGQLLAHLAPPEASGGLSLSPKHRAQSPARQLQEAQVRNYCCEI